MLCKADRKNKPKMRKEAVKDMGCFGLVSQYAGGSSKACPLLSPVA